MKLDLALESVFILPGALSIQNHVEAQKAASKDLDAGRINSSQTSQEREGGSKTSSEAGSLVRTSS